GLPCRAAFSCGGLGHLGGGGGGPLFLGDRGVGRLLFLLSQDGAEAKRSTASVRTAAASRRSCDMSGEHYQCPKAGPNRHSRTVTRSRRMGCCRRFKISGGTSSERHSLTRTRSRCSNV